MIFKKLFKRLLGFSFVNIGQIEFVNTLLMDNFALSLEITTLDLDYFVGLIMMHGKYAEFLSIFEVLLQNAEHQPDSSQLQNNVLDIIFDESLINLLNVI